VSTIEPSKYQATLYHQATPATTYWRCELPARFLPGKVHAAPHLSVEHHEDGSLLFPDVENGVAIMQFPGDQGSALIATVMESQGLKFIVEVDDNYLDRGDELWRLRAGWGQTIGDTPHTTQGHAWICEHAAGVIVTTEQLKQAYDRVNDNVVVARNSIDPDDWPPYVKPRDDVFRIGWYASGSHDRDQMMCKKAMAWASRQDNVEIVNIGLNPTGWNFSRRWIGWRDDFLEHRHELLKLDVGISPLIGTPMTKFRSDVKALEYAMGGAMPILQGERPYDEWRDKPFARICWTPADWMNAIQWAVRNRDEVRRLGAACREHVLKERTFRTEIHKWRAAIGGDV
jgi:hypothetical protein